MQEKGKQGRPYCPMLLINISSFLGLRLKLDEHSFNVSKYCLFGKFFWYSRQNTDAWYWRERPVFINCFQIFFSASIECQPTILAHCIDNVYLICKIEMVSCLSDSVFFSQLPLQKSTSRTPYPSLYCYHGNKTPKHQCVCHHSWQLVS